MRLRPLSVRRRAAERPEPFESRSSTGEGTIDADEFREMLPLLAGDEHLPFARVESLFKQADKVRAYAASTPRLLVVARC